MNTTTGSGGRQATAEDERAVIDELAAKVRTWDRWPDAAEQGALNHLTPASRVRAAQFIRTGEVYSLGLPIKNGLGPQSGAAGRFNPLHLMTVTGDAGNVGNLGGNAGYTDDVLIMPVQGTTQWDALCHVHYDGLMYGGRSSQLVTAVGAEVNGIDKVNSLFVGRGVLLDVSRFVGNGNLPAGYHITCADLDRTADAQGTSFLDGDIVLIRTGLGHAVSAGDWSVFGPNEPGLHYSTATWFADRRVSAIAADNTRVEATGQMQFIKIPLHMLLLRDAGIHLGELWYLEALAQACEADGRYEFFLAAQALPINGGTGSPVNPVAIR
jgi:kynurenine formamidase